MLVDIDGVLIDPQAIIGVWATKSSFSKHRSFIQLRSGGVYIDATVERIREKLQEAGIRIV